ncbi:serine protease [Falsiphaeobacter marinintestinus]|uniref:serine protease n=1 Tax=Falsiphaeobacter marinintestinus TaxID=1492905 RepID=UPI0011B7D496|nr:serine protease [Phaeobacter marinintestinus]
MKRLFAAVLLIFTVFAPAVSAQQAPPDVAWVQIEAHPSLTVAQNRARDYAAQLADVNGFSLGGSWYGIVLGPYTPDDARRVLQVYRAERQIPRDSFLVQTRQLGQQFWPVGADILNRGAVTAPVPQPEPETQVEAPTPEPADETPSQARRGEQLLTRDERKDLQIALQAAGFYNSTIDGAFGRGTRRSMAEWQINNQFEPTGILTTLQRQTLMDQYNAPLISVGMRRKNDLKAGIGMEMPADVVRFSRYEPPFAHYDAATDLGARVLLISQPGDQRTLFGLYDIMQTLKIVPLDGPRERSKDRFTLEGRGNGIVSYTEARLTKGEIKGFTLVWPQGDEARRTRVLAAMKASFDRLDGVLDPAEGGDQPQNIDLVSGLQVRKPKFSRSGFFVDKQGTVVTAVSTVSGCTRITLDHEYDATLVASDPTSGLAILKPKQALAPISVAGMRIGKPVLQAKVAVAGYSYGGVLGAATLTFGTVADVKGLQGETNISRLDLTPLPGDAGGPVMDEQGGVLGMLAPSPENGQRLPDDVSFLTDADTIRDALRAEGVEIQTSFAARTLAPDDLSRLATGMTVLVSCWD